MAAYPSTLPIDGESRRIIRDGREEDTVGDGATRVRKLHADKFDFEIKHPRLSASQMTTLTNFYAANAAADITLTWPEDGATYNVRFGKDALRTAWVAASYRDAWVRLVGV